eukprot:9816992-Lingulodinium_polyedra.AAC.1
MQGNANAMSCKAMQCNAMRCNAMSVVGHLQPGPWRRDLGNPRDVDEGQGHAVGKFLHGRRA